MKPVVITLDEKLTTFHGLTFIRDKNIRTEKEAVEVPEDGLVNGARVVAPVYIWPSENEANTIAVSVPYNQNSLMSDKAIWETGELLEGEMRKYNLDAYRAAAKALLEYKKNPKASSVPYDYDHYTLKLIDDKGGTVVADRFDGDPHTPMALIRGKYEVHLTK